MGQKSLEYGVAAFNNLYKNYRYTAIKRCLLFELSKEDFKILTSTACFYCNRDPYQKLYSSNANISNSV